MFRLVILCHRFRQGVVLIFNLFQPLARMGASVTGVDAVDKNIKIARLHAVGSLLFILWFE